jgi:hypothetical protein
MTSTIPTPARIGVPEQVTPRIDCTLRCPCGAEWIWDEVHGWMGLADLSADSARPACNQPTCVSPSPPQR